MTTTQTAAAEIVSQMSTDDRQGFTKAGWRDGVQNMIAASDDWQTLSAADVLDEIEAYLDTYEAR